MVCHNHCIVLRSELARRDEGISRSVGAIDDEGEAQHARTEPRDIARPDGGVADRRACRRGTARCGRAIVAGPLLQPVAPRLTAKRMAAKRIRNFGEAMDIEKKLQRECRMRPIA